jgi:phosphotriesterase-related protein
MTTNTITVRGLIDSDKLGITSMHEHVPLDKAGKWWQDAMDFSVNELLKAKTLGLSTLVEVSPKRDVRGIKEVAEKSGVNIVVCTGFYRYSDEEKQYSEEKFYRHIMQEIDEGIDGTYIRPGVIKIRADKSELTEYEIRALTAAGRAQVKSGLPLCTHAVSGCARQQEVLGKAGADLNKLYFSHTEAEQGWEGRSLEQEIKYLTTVVARGSTLAYNNFGNWAHTKPESLIAIIRALIEAGYGDRQVATIDLVWSYDPDGKRKVLWSDINADGPRRTYAYVLSDVVPWLRSYGIAEEDIKKMILGNPRRLFEGV